MYENDWESIQVKVVTCIALIFFLSGCTEDNFPEGLYDYQVERLLSAGDSKIWVLVSETEDGTTAFPQICSDSTRLLVTATGQDSINIFRLFPNVECSAFDTLNLGNANASGDLLFTDTLHFASGDFWRIQEITSTRVQLFTKNQKLEILHNK